MLPGHVAYGLRAQYGLDVGPDLVTAWERGLRAPDSREVSALAGVLWCDPADLLYAARSLREHRTVRGVAPADLARRVGISLDAYQKMEVSGRWRGTERQSAALIAALGLSPAQFVTAAGRDRELAELLESAVTTRWQAYVKPLAKLVPVDRAVLEDALPRLHADYQSRMVATLGWGGGVGDAGDGAAGREFLEEIVGHFWARVRGR
ncbi:helix-turn-helix transcriptional regulator [Streptomyces sp. NBC_00237]|uniref:helix-turn-helix domain-containing protein n=1 Tax=Streptomyces sp. NBC_00237 TaxID=2975687 RepID=UPI002256928D|nr:helix-turn-helix transcriptional regulator [Streptomyces sp. NBC_00237]MCX5204109.1 helix-turn-helix transcriptional regulator [Streptomyces sp. NBC_00237]